MATVNAVNTYIVPTVANEVTMPSQPAFLATKNADTANTTGNGAIFTMNCNTEIFDQNADFNNGTYTFTAPVTGRYKLNAKYELYNIAIANDGSTRIDTSNRNYLGIGHNWANAMTATNIDNVEHSVLADMDAADTSTTVVFLQGEVGDTVGVGGAGGAAAPDSFFSGVLVV